MLVHRLLHKEYDGARPETDGKITRPKHGAQHQSRVAVWAVVLLTMRREMGDQAAVDFPDNLIPALMKTCLLHDSGRKGDGRDQKEWEEVSGQQCKDHLIALGLSEAVAEYCGKAIQYKDDPKTFPYKNNANAEMIRSLLHDADTLDVIRVRNNFFIDFLEIWHNLNSSHKCITHDFSCIYSC
ncbi:hypothetical protein ACH42_07385 [Endozoicomonas sp. (ex Bugula neritina AB1)]|nr:hypothetical protein ACH42_07385 [Endozoicomonas sp. (ex Bugula neritina AB1)]